MSKVITFSRLFPAYHPKKGEPTFFIEKLYASLADTTNDFQIPNDANDYWDWYEYYNCNSPKHHTIRAGNRWKVGDKFSPRVWSGKPYNSKQIILAPDIEIKSVWEITTSEFGEFKIGERYLEGEDFEDVAKNDGLDSVDLFNWFIQNPKKPKPFTGQIICWNESIQY
jgi:hypothetical protein